MAGIRNVVQKRVETVDATVEETEEVEGAMATLRQALILALISISTAVTIQLLKHHNAWGLIVVYWIVLTIKNVVDYIGRKRDER